MNDRREADRRDEGMNAQGMIPKPMIVNAMPNTRFLS